MENEGETACKCSMEVIWCPRYPVVAIIDVRVIIMPRPPQQLDAHDVKGDVKQHYTQANWNIKDQGILISYNNLSCWSAQDKMSFKF